MHLDERTSSVQGQSGPGGKLGGGVSKNHGRRLFAQSTLHLVARFFVGQEQCKQEQSFQLPSERVEAASGEKVRIHRASGPGLVHHARKTVKDFAVRCQQCRLLPACSCEVCICHGLGKRDKLGQDPAGLGPGEHGVEHDQRPAPGTPGIFRQSGSRAFLPSHQGQQQREVCFRVDVSSCDIRAVAYALGNLVLVGQRHQRLNYLVQFHGDVLFAIYKDRNQEPDCVGFRGGAPVGEFAQDGVEETPAVLPNKHAGAELRAFEPGSRKGVFVVGPAESAVNPILTALKHFVAVFGLVFVAEFLERGEADCRRVFTFVSQRRKEERQQTRVVVPAVQE
mmetsp:Transcript_10618/g.30033  ORF Transcript_10618/g.30033 Transcript_10618/m.30033 type:complete len:337 (-) Transcript_10618:412-1422(-)